MIAGKPKASSPGVSRRMRGLPTKGTEPELALRGCLHRLGLRYRVQYRLPGLPRRTIDIAFPGKRVAIFVDGCFWHGCSEHRDIPKSNREWWLAKIENNKKRDVDTDRRLHELGWLSLRFWEHDNAQEAADRVAAIVQKRPTVRRRSPYFAPATPSKVKVLP